MAVNVGANPLSGDLNGYATGLAADLEKACARALALARYVDSIDVDGLEQAGFSTDDAGTYKAGVDYLKTVAAVFFGNAAVPEAFDFSNALAAFIGPAPG